jgi:hypothetical protein
MAEEYSALVPIGFLLDTDLYVRVLIHAESLHVTLLRYSLI